jgi:NAD(P)-dependent dehydrogenase (short-subunit alcohol dehydrogenase family)
LSDPLKGRRALVTGSAVRTGRELALALARAGADVAVHGRRRRDELEATCEEVRSLGRVSVVAAGDLSDAGEAEHVIDAAAEGLGGLDILVNNVGVIVWKDLEELEVDDWKRSIDGTLNLTYHACRAALPRMRRQKWGRIINILDADADALAPVRFATPYKIGKIGSLVLTKSLAVVEAPHGITVNAISPGVLENSERSVPLDRIPAGRAGTADDIAAALLFLAGDGAAYITGANLKVSGGYLI